MWNVAAKAMNEWIAPAPVPLQFSHPILSDLLRGTKTFRQLHPSGREGLTFSSAKSTSQVHRYWRRPRRLSPADIVLLKVT